MNLFISFLVLGCLCVSAFTEALKDTENSRVEDQRKSPKQFLDFNESKDQDIVTNYLTHAENNATIKQKRDVMRKEGEQKRTPKSEGKKKNKKQRRKNRFSKQGKKTKGARKQRRNSQAKRKAGKKNQKAAKSKREKRRKKRTKKVNRQKKRKERKRKMKSKQSKRLKKERNQNKKLKRRNKGKGGKQTSRRTNKSKKNLKRKQKQKAKQRKRAQMKGKSNLQKTSGKKFRILQRKANMRKKTPKKRQNLQKLAINGNETEISNFFKTLRNRVKRWPYWFERKYLRASKRVESMKSKSNDEKTDSFDSSYSYLSKGVGEFALFCPNVDYRVAKLKKITKDLETLKECKQELKDNCPDRELPSGWKEGEICLSINSTYLKQHDAAVDKALKNPTTNAVEYFNKAIELNKDWVKNNMSGTCESITKFNTKINKENRKCVNTNIKCKEAASSAGAHILECSASCDTKREWVIIINVRIDILNIGSCINNQVCTSGSCQQVQFGGGGNTNNCSTNTNNTAGLTIDQLDTELQTLQDLLTQYTNTTTPEDVYKWAILVCIQVQVLETYIGVNPVSGAPGTTYLSIIVYIQNWLIIIQEVLEEIPAPCTTSTTSPTAAPCPCAGRRSEGKYNARSNMLEKREMNEPKFLLRQGSKSQRGCNKTEICLDSESEQCDIGWTNPDGWVGFPSICVPCDIEASSGPTCQRLGSKNCLCKDIKTWQNFTACSQPEKVSDNCPTTSPTATISPNATTYSPPVCKEPTGCEKTCCSSIITKLEDGKELLWTQQFTSGNGSSSSTNTR